MMQIVIAKNINNNIILNYKIHMNNQKDMIGNRMRYNIMMVSKEIIGMVVNL